jgi:hypothetical protein
MRGQAALSRFEKRQGSQRAFYAALTPARN